MATGTSDIPISAPPPAESSAPRVARASVDVGAITTFYQRAGCGSPVLVLSGGPGDDPVRERLLAALAPRFRVIAPEPQGDATEAHAGSGRSGGAAFSAWLRGFLDGLGLLQVSIVAEERLGIPALGFSLTDADRVERVVLLYRDPADPAAPGGAPPDHLNESDHPLLLARMGDGKEDPSAPLEPRLAAELIGFLRGEPGAGTG